jgi:hypothetical protein
MYWSDYRPTGLRHRDTRSAGGYTLVTPIGGNFVYLLDEDGCIVHGWTVPGFQPGYGYLLPGGRLLVRGQPQVDTTVGVGQPAGKADLLLELDWDSRVIWRWEHETFHHDMCRMPNGNTLVIIWEVMPEDLARRIKGGLTPEQMELVTTDVDFMSFLLQGMGVGGRPRLKGMLTDAICEINPAGEIVHTWHAYEHFDPETDILCSIDLRHEWTHINAVQLTPGGDVLLSSQKLDHILKISWPKGEVLWRWGGIGRLSHQHDPTITPEGNLLVFDNGSRHPIQARSRVLEVDMKTDKIVWQYFGSPVFSFISLHIAGAERLHNGNTLICEGETGRVLEVTPDKDICWEWMNPFKLYFKGCISSMLFRAHRYAAESSELGGMPIKPDEWAGTNAELGLDRAARRATK